MNDYTSIADLYDLYVTDTRDHSFWTSLAAVAAGPILELTAGTGRATTALRAGTTERVVALDRSHAMLLRLVKRFKGQTRVPSPACGDLVLLPFASGTFDLVVIPFNSWSELIEESERTDALRELRRVLAPSGRGVVTLHNPSRRRETLDGAVRKLGPFEWRSRRLEIFVSGSVSTSGVAVSQQVYQLLDSADHVVEERRLELQFVLPDVAELTVVAHASDLEVEVIYGDYDLSPYDPVSSPYILALLRPPTE
jgi:SAM-dependent methyltransferase